MSATEEVKTSARTVQLVDGTLLVVPDSPHVLSTYVLQEQGDWFEDEIKFLRQLVQPGQRVVDIGANYGVYALSLARRVGPTGQVWAFEPASDTARLLAEAISANGTSWVQLETLALSDHEGTAWLCKPGQSELNSLAPTADQEGGQAQGGDGEAVGLTTLDACSERFGWGEIDLLKIDAEGEERRILSGGQRLFRETSPLVMFELKEGVRLHLELIESFLALGYRCFKLVPGLGALVPFDPASGVDGFLLNLFAAKADRAAALAASGWLVEAVALEEGRQVASAQPASGPPQERDWLPALEALEALPYGRALAPLWHGRSAAPGAADHRAALAAWVESRTGSLPLGRRWEALRRSYSLLCQLCQADAPACRCATLTRVALDLGERERAIGALALLHASLGRDGQAALGEPFLAPHPAYDTRDPQGRPLVWLESAALEAEECFGSFSSFFIGAAALPRLRRLSALGMASPAMERRLQLVQSRCPDAPPPAAQNDNSVRPWFDSLELGAPLRCLDGGALAGDDTPSPWVRWAREGCAEVIGFQPLPQECERLNQRVAHLGGAVRYSPLALGDGAEHTLHVTKTPTNASLLAPALATADLFAELGEGMRVERCEALRTSRLDDLSEIRPVDFLKLHARGTELMVLRHATATLADVAVVQCGVAFVELYEGQPLQADVDRFLRSQGFSFLRFSSVEGRPFKPVHLDGQPLSPISQILWSDAIYVRDVREREQWSSRQLKAAIFVLHELYQAFDLAALLLSELDRRQQSDWQPCYLASLLFSEPSLRVE